MEYINISTFKETCAYCYTDIYDPQGIMVCKCGVSVCQIHKNVHLWREEHIIIYFVFAIKEALKSNESKTRDVENKDIETTQSQDILTTQNNNKFKDLFVHSTILSPDEIYILEESLKEILSKNKTVDNIPYEDKAKCSHIEEIKWKGKYRIRKELSKENNKTEEKAEKRETNKTVEMEIKSEENKIEENIISKGDNKCTDCDITINTWLCLSCGYIGCGRKQYGMTGNGHALNHNINTNHNIFIKIETIKGLGTGDCYCYKCDNYIYNEILEKKLKDINFYTFGNYKGTAINRDLIGGGDISKGNDSVTKSSNYQHTRTNNTYDNNTVNQDTDNNKDNYLHKYVGIRNTGETCFISAALQMICNAIKYEEIDYEDHFIGCRKNPLECFGCQFMRLVGGIKNGNKSVIFIDDLINVLRSGDTSMRIIDISEYDGNSQEYKDKLGGEYKDNSTEQCKDNCTDKHSGIKYINKNNLSLLCKQLSSLLKGQQDVIEFVEIFMSYLQEYENNSDIPNISKYFNTTVVIESYCSKGSRLEGVSNYNDCLGNNTPVKNNNECLGNNAFLNYSQNDCNFNPSIKEENIFIFSFPFKEKVSEGIKEYFKESKEKCGCGGVIITRRSIVKAGLNMLVHVDRVVLSEKGVIKVNDSLSVDEYDVVCYYRDSSVQGISKSKYLWKSSVCHFGERTLSGHYVWVVGDEGIVVVNDSSVKKSDEGVVGQSFLLCYSV